MTAEAFVVGKLSPSALRAINYAPGVDGLRRKRGGVTRLGVLAEVGGSFGAVFTRIDCDPAHGVPLYAQVDTFASEPAGRVIRRDSMPRPDKQSVRRWQILIAAAGQMAEGNLFGRSIIADDRLTNGYCGPDTLALTFEQPGSDENLWAYAFLNTSLGLRAVRACAYGTSIPRLRPDLIADIPVPLADARTVARVASLIRRCVEQRELYLLELQAARKLLEALPEMCEAHAMSSERGPRAVAWGGPMPTLRAWNFASTGEALSLLRRSWSGRLADCLENEGLFKGGRLVRIPCSSPHGVDLLSQRDVFAIRPVPRRIQRPADASLDVTEGMLLLASRGQMNEGAIFGLVERAVHMPSRAIVSEDITRLVPRQPVLEGLYAFLSTAVGLALLRSTAYGTSIPGMRMDLLSQLPVPEDSVLQRCSRRVEASTAARLVASSAEVEAIRIVEEEVLPKWLA